MAAQPASTAGSNAEPNATGPNSAKRRLTSVPSSPQPPFMARFDQFPSPGSTGPNALNKDQLAALALLHDTDVAFIAELDQRIVDLQSLRAGLLLRAKAYRDWATPATGHRTFSDWRGEQSGMGAKAAAAELGNAHTLDSTPEVQDAVSDGGLTMEHVSVLTNVTRRATRTGGRTLTDTETTALVDMGKTRTAEQFAKDANRWLDGRDPVAHDASHAEIRRRRFLHLSHASNGTHIKGFIDPIAGHTLRIALEAAQGVPSITDDRDFGQRNADALEAVATLVLNTGTLKNGALVKPHVSFLMTETTYQDASKELNRRKRLTRLSTRAASGVSAPGASGPGASGPGASEPGESEPVSSEPGKPEPIAMTPATLEDGTPVPLTELTRLLCDAEMTRIVLNAKNIPVNLGRTERLYSREQRRAIIARDRSCRFHGCTLEARWAEVHHIEEWVRDNGETSIDNGVLACRFHHGEIHRGALTVIRDDFGLPQLVLTEAFTSAQLTRAWAPTRVPTGPKTNLSAAPRALNSTPPRPSSPINGKAGPRPLLTPDSRAPNGKAGPPHPEGLLDLPPF